MYFTRSLKNGRSRVHGVEAFGLTLRQVDHARGDDLEADLFEAAVDLRRSGSGYAVGLDDGQSAFERHGMIPWVGVGKARDCTGWQPRAASNPLKFNAERNFSESLAC